MKRLFLAASFLFISFLPLLTSCDGGMHLSGTVYEWLDAPSGSQGQIIIDGSIPADLNVKPIAGAQISVINKAGRSTMKLVSNTDGSFTGGNVVAPTQEEYTITVSAESYATISKIFLHPAKIQPTDKTLSNSRVVNILMVH